MEPTWVSCKDCIDTEDICDMKVEDRIYRSYVEIQLKRSYPGYIWIPYLNWDKVNQWVPSQGI